MMRGWEEEEEEDDDDEEEEEEEEEEGEEEKERNQTRSTEYRRWVTRGCTPPGKMNPSMRYSQRWQRRRIPPIGKGASGQG